MLKNKYFKVILSTMLVVTMLVCSNIVAFAADTTSSARSVDSMLLKSQQWLNENFSSNSAFGSVPEDGTSRRATVNGCIRALQIRLGIVNTADNFGQGTESLFKSTYKNGIVQQEYPSTEEDKVYGIIQCALWTKGYSTGSSSITKHFYDGTGNAIKELKEDMGFNNPNSTVTLNVMKGLLSMDQYVKVSGGDDSIRLVQQSLNREYEDYVGIIPCDGLYGRQMNKALIKVLQAIEGYSVDDATGNFGTGTKNNLYKLYLPENNNNIEVINLLKYCLCCNGYGRSINLSSSSWDTALQAAVKKFREDVNLSSEAKVDTNTWMALLLSKGNPDRTCTACDTNQRLDQDKINYLKTNGYYLVGRYLANSAKGITRDEAELILDNNMKFFPIFQSSGLDESISSFTLNRADQDAISALAYAKNLGLPQRTIIYFAVDYDATDYDISEYVLPYFKSLYNKVKNEYKVGIYGTRNVCTKVMSAGYATTCFVSDMSTGYSGNMGFKMPSDWNLDQFASVSTTVEGKKFKFDKVSYKGNYAIVTSLVEPVNIDPIYNVTEGEFVLDKDYPVNIGTARKFSGRYLKLNIKVTGKDGEILNDGTAVRISLMKTESNDGDPYMDLLPLIVPNVKANGTIYTAANFSIKDRDYIIIDDIHHYYLKYELMNPDTSKSVRIKVIMESYTD